MIDENANDILRRDTNENDSNVTDGDNEIEGCKNHFNLGEKDSVGNIQAWD